MTADTSAKKIWFITGASSGLGQSMALSALRAGHQVIGTGRDIKKAASNNPKFEENGGRWLELDVSKADAQHVVEQLMEEEEQRLGTQSQIHWVVVNNAGFDLLGAVEDMSEEQILRYFQANVFGVIRVWKAALPYLRRHRAGTVITMSSMWGLLDKPEQMIYCAVKSTIESLTQSYAGLLAPLGIRVIVLAPGAFRTSFAANAIRSDRGISEDYREHITSFINWVESARDDLSILGGNPDLFGPVVTDAVDGQGRFELIWAQHDPTRALRVPMGSDSYDAIGTELKSLNAWHIAMSDIARSTDIEN
ncbi:hypothetical protein GGI35DRAFT_487718 [Trichoderma velutinum]